MGTYQSGLAAEDTIVRKYLASGLNLLERRCRNEGGEIDLVLEDDDTLVFVEVKQRKSIETAAYSISQRQWSRIAHAAQIYIAQKDYPFQTNMRFDAALTDRYGNVEILENAASFEH